MIRESIKGAWTGLWRRASSLAQSVHGGSAQVNEKRLQGAAMLWKRLYKHDETEETRRPARPKYKKFYPVLVSPVNFLNWWQFRIWMIIMFALTPKFRHLLQKDDCVPMFADVTPFLVRWSKIENWKGQNGKEKRGNLGEGWKKLDRWQLHQAWETSTAGWMIHCLFRCEHSGQFVYK